MAQDSYKFRVEGLSDCQPIFQAYCAAHGLRDGDTWISYEFMAWASGMATEFRRVFGVPEGMLPLCSAEYVAWVSLVAKEKAPV